MDMKVVSCLRTGSSLFTLFVSSFLLGTFAFASASSITIASCGSDHFSCAKFRNNELLLSINGEYVGKARFCEAVHFHKMNGCIFKVSFRNDFCELQPVLGRRGLQEKAGEVKNYREFVVHPMTIGLAASGFFVLCCAVFCPCFRKERKATSHEVLPKELNTVHRVSSSETGSPSEKVEHIPFRVPHSPARYTTSPKINKTGPHSLSMSQILKATNNFSKNSVIGEGGFGVVYKGQLDNGQVVAIKHAKKEHFENVRSEFKSEVELLSKIEHQNLVRLLAYVDRGSERLIITEYVTNGTLRDHLDGVHGRTLDFNQRLGIAIDISHGLTYLHLYSERQIIHRDVRASNILLTESMRAKVADFGFARWGSIDPSQTHISTQVRGTVGYLDPEYMRTSHLTTKSDVYSFGILLVEILTGRRPVEPNKPSDERITIRWAYAKYTEGKVLELVDPMMKETIPVRTLKKMFALAFQCAAPVRLDRPDMKIVAEQLWEIRHSYHTMSRNA